MGKSVIVDELAKHLIVDNGLSVLLVKPEEDKTRTYQKLVAKAASRIFNDPEVPSDQEAFDAKNTLVAAQAMSLDSCHHSNRVKLQSNIRIEESKGAR